MAFARDGVAAAEQIGWRFLLLEGHDAVAAGIVDEVYGSWRLEELNVGPQVPGTVHALGVAERYLAPQEAEYEVRHLVMPSVYVAAKCLHSAGGEDVFIPMADHHDAGVTAGQMMTEQALRELAGGKDAGGVEAPDDLD